MSCPQVANWICIPLLLKMCIVFELQASDPDFISCVILNFHTCYNDDLDTNVGDAYFVSFPANPPSGAGWWQANIGRCNVLVHVGIKPFSEAELTHTHVARWRHLTTMGWYYHLNRNSSVNVIWHYSDVMNERGGVLKSPASWWFVQPFVQELIKENIKAPRLRPFWVEFIDDRWIPFHEELVMRKMFPFDDVILARVSTIYNIRGMANEHFTSTMIIVYDNDTL